MIGRHPLFRPPAPPHHPAAPMLETGRSRLMLTGFMFAAAFTVIALRLVDLALFNPSVPHIAGRAEADRPKFARADVVDRTGVLLATSLVTASLYANPRDVPDPGRAAARLSRVLPELRRTKIRAKLESERNFVWLRRHLSPRQQFAVNRLGIPGLEFRRESRRIYPSGALAAHVLGHTDIDNNGQAGIERAMDKTLRRRTAPLALTIDSRVQHVMEQELGRAKRKFRAIGAVGIVQDVSNGEILALVSLPGFDPNDPTDVDPEARFNRASLGVYEMGSTFKIFTIAMALDSGSATFASRFDATRPIRVSRYVIRDLHGKNRWLTVPEIFIYSSNIGAARMAIEVGTARQRAFLTRLGMLRAASIELGEVGKPLMPRRWSEIHTMTIAFGHGLAVSPVQLVNGVSAIINGGILYAPTLIKRAGEQAAVGTRVISARTSDRMRRLMRLVVTDGTGSRAEVAGYLVGGKTGTAEKVMGRRYKEKALISSFVGAFPINAPRYAVFAMLDEPSGTPDTRGYATGGWVAAPVVGRVIARIGPMLGVAPVDEDAADIRRQMAVQIEPEPAEKRRLASY
jgi:cell division protein FtsI (penicillin-binding protein 3)